MEYWNPNTLSDLREFSASDEEFRQIVSEFFSDAFSLLHQICECQHNISLLRTLLHTLKGLARSFGAIALSQKAFECEQRVLQSQPLDAQHLSELIQTLENTQFHLPITLKCLKS